MLSFISLRYISLYVSIIFTLFTVPLFVSFSFILTLSLYLILSPTLYSFLRVTTSFVTSNSSLVGSNFCVCTSEIFPAPSIAYICIYLALLSLYTIFPIGISSFSSLLSYSVPASDISSFDPVGFSSTIYLYFFTPVVIVALFVSLVNSLDPSKPFT